VRSRPDSAARGRRRAALVGALSAIVLLSAGPRALAEPVVYQADPQSADCVEPGDTTAGCPPTGGAVTQSARDSESRSSRPRKRDESDTRSGDPDHRGRSPDGPAGRPTAPDTSSPDPQAGGGTAPSTPPGADTTSGTGTGDQQPSPATAGDPFSDLGGRSPSCRRGAAGQSSANCRATGSPAHRYAIGNYTYDIKIDTGVTHFTDNLLAALQTIASFLWLGFLYAIKGVLLALDWAFHLNFINTNINKVQGGLLTMDSIFGLDSGYFSLALSVAALWGMWHGFVRGKYIETIAGLGACVGLMLIALLIVHDPAGTVGKVGNWGDAAGREVASGVAGAVQPGNRTQANEDGLDRGAQAIFDTIVLRPWCALEFGDVNFCLSKPPTDAKYYDDGKKHMDAAASAPTVADLWLRYPANGDERNDLFESWKDHGDTATQSRVQMMQGQSTGKRLALLVLIVAGLLGALLLLGWIAFWLIAYAALALFFLLLAPFVFLMPALGDAGRRGFIGWGKRLLGALIAKLLYAIVLGIVIYVAALIAEMGNPGGLGWLGVWVIEGIFWWVAFLKRHELVNLLTFNAAHGGESTTTRRDGLAGLYYKSRLAQEAMRTVHRPVARHVRRQVAREAMTEAGAARAVARERLGHHAERALNLEYRRGREKLRERRQLQNELKGVESALRAADETRALNEAAKSTHEPGSTLQTRAAPLDPETEQRLRARRAELQDQIDAPEMRRADQLVRRAETNHAEHGSRWTTEDHERWLARRRAELAEKQPAVGDPAIESYQRRMLLASGIDPDRYLTADPQEQRELLQRADHAQRIQKDLLRVVPADGDIERPRYSDLRALRRRIHNQEWREARTQERRAIHREAWRRRARDNVYRVRR
jgi:hypothetical protein